MRRRLGVRLEHIIKCYESRKPESGYKRTKYCLRGFHSDPVFAVRVTQGPQHTLTAGCARQGVRALRPERLEGGTIWHQGGVGGIFSRFVVRPVPVS